MLTHSFFNQDASHVAQQLLGKVILHKVDNLWLSARIIETEAYYLADKASHSSLGYTHARRAMFMPPGTIYMYHARGKPSLNVSCKGEGNAVLIKSGFPYQCGKTALSWMQAQYPKVKKIEQLCAGQTLLCQSLGLKVSDWNAKTFQSETFFFKNIDEKPKQIIQTTRLGIPPGRDEHLLNRFIDYDFARYCTSNPLRKRTPCQHIVKPYSNI